MFQVSFGLAIMCGAPAASMRGLSYEYLRMSYFSAGSIFSPFFYLLESTLWNPYTGTMYLS